MFVDKIEFDTPKCCFSWGQILPPHVPWHTVNKMPLGNRVNLLKSGLLHLIFGFITLLQQSKGMIFLLQSVSRLSNH